MSGSLSPHTSSPPPNVLSSPQSTTLRSYKYDEPSNNPIESQQQSQQSVVPSSITPQSPDPRLPQSNIKRSLSFEPPEGSTSNTPMTKRLRKGSTVTPESSPKRTSSPSELEEQKHEGDSKGKQPETQPSGATPAKKKRTRTLTTPHQAAVLNALLAQSRFPTTAMREEVGRSIGLSARKVQIWFQNQRQKARRPKKEPDGSTHLPPQYGPFPAYPPAANTGAFPLVPAAGPSNMPNPQFLPSHYNQPVQQPYPGQPPYPPRPGAISTETPSRLLGPGVPGADIHGSSYLNQSRGPWDTTSSQDTSISGGTPDSFSPQIHSPKFGPPLPLPRSTAAFSSLYDQSFDRKLPPLSVDRLRNPRRTRISPEGSQPESPPFIILPPPEPSRSFSQSSVSSQLPPFLQQSPETSGHSRTTVPPPFTLQPEPQWDDTSYSEIFRQSAFSSPRTRSHSAHDFSSTPVHRTDPQASSTSAIDTPEREASVVSNPIASRSTLPHPRASPMLPPRIGRYDPVRAMIVPYSAASASPTDSQNGSGNVDVDLDNTRSSPRDKEA